MDTSKLDRAIKLAVDAHKGAARRGKGFPYIIHPLEAAAIAATMTDDQDLLCAAVLHDVIEDSDYTADDIERELGKRIADLVVGESDEINREIPKAETWNERKRTAVKRIKSQGRDGKIVALSDKLSNMRIIYRDYRQKGEALWNEFNVTDPADQKWYYCSLADSLSELSDTDAYKEFVELLGLVFDYQP